jgi:uncharacterized membrane protein YvbJ
MTDAPEPAPAPLYDPPPAVERKKPRVGRIIAIVAAVVVALVIIVGGGLFLLVNQSTKDAQKVSDELVTAVQNGDGAKVWSLAGPTFRGVTSQDDVNQLVAQLSPLVTKEKASPNSKSINASTDTGKIAVFLYTLKGNNRGPVYFKTQIREEQDKWQVLSFRSSDSKLNSDIE